MCIKFWVGYVAMVMIRINLVPWRSQHRSQTKKRILILFVIGLLFAFLLLCCVHHFLVKKIDTLNVNYKKLEQQQKKLAADYNHMKLLQQQKSKEWETVEFIKKTQQDGSQLHQFLRMLSIHMPAVIYLIFIKQSREIVVLGGSALALKDIALFVQELERFPQVKQAKIITANHADKKHEMYFEIQVLLKE